MPTSKLTNDILNAALLGFEEQKRRIDLQIADVRSMLPGGEAAPAAPASTGRLRRKMSAAGRRAIAQAQRERWASKRQTAGGETPARAKRRLSAAGKAAIIAATKKRWAAYRAAAAKK